MQVDRDTHAFLSEMVEIGFAILPGIPNTKKPKTKWSNYCKTQDQIDKLFSYGDNVAVVCGKSFEHGIVVIDCDTNKETGAINKVKIVVNEKTKTGDIKPVTKRVLEWNDSLLNTFTVKSRSGGLHFYYKLREDSFEVNSVNVFGDGVDVRGKNGIIWFPPSQINGKAYEIFNDVDISYLPPELEKVMKDYLDRQTIINRTVEERAQAFISTLCNKSEEQRVALECLKFIESDHPNLDYREWFAIYSALVTVFENKETVLTIMSEWSTRFTEADKAAIKSIETGHYKLGTIVFFAIKGGYKIRKVYPNILELVKLTKGAF